jgi:hypothetical protein
MTLPFIVLADSAGKTALKDSPSASYYGLQIGGRKQLPDIGYSKLLLRNMAQTRAFRAKTVGERCRGVVRRHMGARASEAQTFKLGFTTRPFSDDRPFLLQNGPSCPQASLPFRFVYGR